jgi:organic hydroperoxide reductase OsmC/OhrA
MPTAFATYRPLAGTRAAVGRAGNHALIADRPAGVSGGEGLGFNGGQLLALALGACFSNNVQNVSEELGEPVADLQIDVTIELEGSPPIATSAELVVRCQLASGADPEPLLERAKARCTIANSLRAGVEVAIVNAVP